MCPESLVHLAEGRVANIGDEGTIKYFRDGQHRYTMYALKSAPDCPVCLPDGSAVQFSNLPANIQKRAETGPEAVAVLQNGAAYISTFEFENGAVATLDELRSCTFTVIPAVEDIDREAHEVMGEVGQTLYEEATDVEPVLVGA